jgi:2-polyprenyl-3-methyl-5-hydroxy-6-metoxy-1,4-benzoquinol methylase
MSDGRRKYFDHEPAYEAILARGGGGWADLRSPSSSDDYDAFQEFVESPPFRELKARRAIDLGCGGGQCAIVLGRLGLHVVGIDFSETAIALARRNALRANLSCEFVRGDCIELEGTFRDASFDLAIDNHALHCIIGPDRRAFLDGCFQALRPGGLLFSETMSAEGSIDFEAYRIDRRTRVNHVGNRFFTTEIELHTELAAAGFVVVSSARRPQDDRPPCGDMLVVVATRPQNP